MDSRSYTILLTPEDGVFTVRVPSMPGIATEGDTIEEAIAMAKDAMRLYLETLIARGEPIPIETGHTQALVVDIAA